MIIRSFSTIFLWGLVALVVYSLKETGAMWILNLCATLTLFEVYTILGRLGYAANRLSGLITGGCLIPISYYFEGFGVDVLAIGALFTSAACVLFPQAQRGMYIKRLMPTFFGLLFVSSSFNISFVFYKLVEVKMETVLWDLDSFSLSGL
jgi:hypothetical protein